MKKPTTKLNKVTLSKKNEGKRGFAGETKTFISQLENWGRNKQTSFILHYTKSCLQPGFISSYFIPKDNTSREIKLGTITPENRTEHILLSIAKNCFPYWTDSGKTTKEVRIYKIKARGIFYIWHKSIFSTWKIGVKVNWQRSIKVGF